MVEHETGGGVVCLIYLCLRDIYMLFRNRKGLLIGIVILITVMFACVGGISAQAEKAHESAERIENEYGIQQSFFVREGLSDQAYFRYCDDNNEEVFYKLKHLLTLLWENEEIRFYTQIEHQGLQVVNEEVPNEFLIGYEAGDYEYSINAYEGEELYSTKAVYVSDYFFEEYNIRVSDGRKFVSSDYIYSPQKDVPIILGNDYKNIYDVGDKISGYFYLDDKTTFEVVGFLQPDNYFFSYQENDFISTNRYIIIPALQFDNVSLAAKIMMLQEIGGIIISNYTYEKTSEIFEGYLAEAGLKNFGVYIQNPDSERVMRETVAVYSTMTQEVAFLFQIVLGLIVLLAVITISIIICTCIRDNLYSYGILMLCGAGKKNILIEILLFISGLFLFSDILSYVVIVIVGGKTSESIHLLGLALTIITSLISFVYISKINIDEIVGGRE